MARITAGKKTPIILKKSFNGPTVATPGGSTGGGLPNDLKSELKLVVVAPPAISTLRRLRQEDLKFKTSLSCIVTLSVK
jgi:hypothetical protein